ncbi:periplasmic binding protein and sugar binding domain of the LacI family protein [Streptococcus constellatus subsp. pharyngis SK1060 = CCUG 46377]|uniref:Periplasmic binding protein and sugar binding domain of the LacI family protein n=1 Tax=Streptococcus constellatus subsp. pharyngis SK1060 = CCUG 46377 TaxID=1035184 RepID=F9P7X0_STRCV|nr:periplasmic binding protein and sugar binding domain of the LacI family protein [Streptococcus constellatus subsp. pharyngis SK1060 = CCUG 46377]
MTGLIFLYVKGNSSDSKQVKIGATYMTMNNDFYKTLNAEIEKKTNQQGSRLYVRDPELDEGKQSQQIDYFIQEKVDVIVINPVKSDSPQILTSLNKARKAGIKIIVVDAPVSKDAKVDTTIVSDNYQAGVLIAKDMMKRLSSANILLLEHHNAVSAMDRIQGFLDTIKGHPAYQVVSERETLGQTEESMPQVKKALNEGMQFNVVMSLNDRAAIGALAAIKDQGVTDKIAIYGVDGSPDIKNFLANTNDIQGTVAQSPIQMGRKVTEVIERMMKHQAYKEEYLIPVHLVNKENIAQYTITGWQ